MAIIAGLAMAWAVFSSVFVIYRNAIDGQERTLRALAVSRLGAAPTDTNEAIQIPRGSVDLIRHLADAEAERSTMFAAFSLVSSVVIAAISLALVFVSRKRFESSKPPGNRA